MVDVDTSAIAAGIRAERARADMTQDMLAEKTGVSKATVSLWESGAQIPGADKVMAIVQALGCAPNDLFCWGK